MTRPRTLHRLLHGLLIAAFVFGTITQAVLAQDNIYLPLITNVQNSPSSSTTNLLFHTHITGNTSMQ